MTVETAPYINGLDASNPSGSGPKAEGDDHVRLIKSAVKATFPNVTGAVTGTHTAINNAVAGTFPGSVTVASSLGVGTNLSVGTHLDTTGDTNVGGSLTVAASTILSSVRLQTTAGTQVTARWYQPSHGDWTIYNPANGSDLRISENVSGTDKVTISSDGNVGLGVTAPTSSLTVYKATNPVVRLLTSTTGTSSTDGLTVEVGTSNHGYVWNYEAADLVLGTSNTERLRIDSAGGITTLGAFTSGAITCNAAMSAATTFTSGTSITAGTNLVVGGLAQVTGNITSVSGNIAASSGNITASGSITGNALFTTTGVNAGSTVNATTGMTMGNSAQSDATVLDYYLEGTWTPTIVGASTAGTPSYNIHNGSYTRVGNRVFCQVVVDFGITGSSGNWVMNMPITPIRTIDTNVPIGSGNIDSSGTCATVTVIATSNTTAVFQYVNTSGATTVYSGNPAQTRVVLNLQYQV